MRTKKKLLTFLYKYDDIVHFVALVEVAESQSEKGCVKW